MHSEKSMKPAVSIRPSTSICCELSNFVIDSHRFVRLSPSYIFVVDFLGWKAFYTNTVLAMLSVQRKLSHQRKIIGSTFGPVFTFFWNNVLEFFGYSEGFPISFGLWRQRSCSSTVNPTPTCTSEIFFTVVKTSHKKAKKLQIKTSSRLKRVKVETSGLRNTSRYHQIFSTEFYASTSYCRMPSFWNDDTFWRLGYLELLGQKTNRLKTGITIEEKATTQIVQCKLSERFQNFILEPTFTLKSSWNL